MADLKQLLRDIPKKNLIYILGAVGIALIFISSISPEKTEPTVIEEDFDYCRTLEEKLEKILPEIASVGKVSVMITAKNYGRVTLAKDKAEGREQTVILNQKGGGEDAMIIEETYPSILGVIIAAEGGSNDKVKTELTEAVSALLGVDAHRIKIFERKIK
ncbi:MAG: hypothetical protein IJ435_06105 [Clostridia bacterium]|nr:hypothetical protein [Clostridia bacterium]